MYPPINFKKWIDEHRSVLKPPVGNCEVYPEHEFIIMVVGGPNSRKDYHINEGEEFFYQIEGDINLKMIENGKPIDFPIREGEIFLLPPRTAHSPRRPAGTIGLVVERQRRPGEKDGFQWYCESCGEKLHEEFMVMKDIVKDLPPIFDRFYSKPSLTKCRKCGADNGKK